MKRNEWIIIIILAILILSTCAIALKLQIDNTTRARNQTCWELQSTTTTDLRCD